MDIVLVEWVDARGVSQDWVPISEMTHGVCTMRSVGWLAKKTAENLIIVPHMGDDPAVACGEMYIPRKAVKRLVVLKEGQ